MYFKQDQLYKGSLSYKTEHTSSRAKGHEALPVSEGKCSQGVGHFFKEFSEEFFKGFSSNSEQHRTSS